MIYIKPSWRNNITGIILIISALGWLNFPSFLMKYTDNPVSRIIIGLFVAVYGIYTLRGKI